MYSNYAWRGFAREREREREREMKSFGYSDVMILAFGCADVSHVVVR